MNTRIEDMFPEKIYVELTTRCNLNCRKCVKFATGSNIVERDMPLDIFEKLLPSFAHLDSLILNGIGEPLLHPHLLEIIRLARSAMPRDASIGFQSNGILLSPTQSLNLIEAGLDTICLSVDSLQKLDAECESLREHSFIAVSEAVSNLVEARKKTAHKFTIGIEIVLKKDTIQDLPALVSWAADSGVNYILTTHLILYDNASEKDTLFDPNPVEAIQLFQKYNKVAISKGIDLTSCFSTYRKFIGTRSDSAALQIFTDMQKEAKEQDIRLNLQGLLSHWNRHYEQFDIFFQKARSIADDHGIDLFLPPVQAKEKKSCPFLVDRATFIAPNGEVMPCHFLWHSYPCWVFQDEINVQQRAFGNVQQQSLDVIWQDANYEEFREEAGRYEYPSCWSCPLAPCPSLVLENISNSNDCYGSQVPCGHCQWNLGGIRCL